MLGLYFCDTSLHSLKTIKLLKRKMKNSSEANSYNYLQTMHTNPDLLAYLLMLIMHTNPDLLAYLLMLIP
nr:hypothetical protein CFP56_08305 [Quercus suber]